MTATLPKIDEADTTVLRHCEIDVRPRLTDDSSAKECDIGRIKTVKHLRITRPDHKCRLGSCDLKSLPLHTDHQIRSKRKLLEDELAV